MTTRIKLRRDTAANWLAANPILSAGEPGLETDTGKVKYGDGVTPWETLPHAGSDSLVSETAIAVQTGDDKRWLLRLRREDDGGAGPGSGVFVNNVWYDSEGNIIATAGVSLNDDGMVVFKVSPSGNVIWKRVIENFGSYYDLQGGLAIDSNDDIWMTMWPDDPGCGLVKLSGSTGNVLYTNTFWNDDAIGVQGFSIATNSDNDLVVVGSMGGYNGPPAVSVLKISGTGGTTGNIIWQKAVIPNGGWSEGIGVAVDYNDNIIITGTENNANGVDKLFVMKFDTAGNWDWQKYIEMSEGQRGAGASVVVDSIGNIFVTGTMFVKNAAPDLGPFNAFTSNAIIVASLDPTGTLNWARQVGPGPCSWVGTGVAVGAEGDLYLVASTVQYRPNGTNQSEGIFDPAIVLARYNGQTGQVVWQRYWNNPNAQDVPAGNSNSGDNNYNNNYTWAGHGIDVKGDKIVIGGSTRMGPSDFDGWVWSSIENFNQGVIAQFDIEASEFSKDGYKLEVSRVPGKLITNQMYTVDENMLVVNTTTYSDNVLDIITNPASVSVRRSASTSNTWTFERNGDLNTPVDTSIKLNQTQLGFGNLYGFWENYNDDVWYQSVARDPEGNVYTLGSTWAGNQYAYVTKFSPTGETLWQWNVRGAEGASFYVSWENNQYTVNYVDNGGWGYRVGDKITLGGADMNGNWSNNLTLNVTGINSNNNEDTGSVTAVEIVDGVAADGSGSNYVYDWRDDGQGDTVGITYDAKTGNLRVLVTQLTWGGDNMDSEWTQSLVHQIDAGTGVVVDTKVFKDSGDVYANGISFNADGEWAVVGEKYNEYQDLGNLTAVAPSGVDKLAVAKSDFTTGHYPDDGEVSHWDTWLTGSNIVDQINLNNVNYYSNLPTTTRQGSGAVFDVTADGNGGYSVSIPTPTGTNYLYGHKIKITGDQLGGTSPANDAIITATATGFGHIETASITGTSAGGATTYTGWPEVYGQGVYLYSSTNLQINNSTNAAALWAVYSSLVPGTPISFVISGTTYNTVIADPATGGGGPSAPYISIVATTVLSGIVSSVTIGSAGSPTTYTAVSGTNYNVGGDGTFNMRFNPADGTFTGDWGMPNGGSNYVPGDILTIAGTNFAGGTSPANDILVTVQGWNGSYITDISVSGSIPGDYLLLNSYNGVDFSAGTGYAAKQNLGGEAFISTPNWDKAIGGPSGDYFNAVAHDSDSNIISVGSGRYDVNYNQGLVVKWASDGTKLWSKTINPFANDAYNTGVVVLSDDSIVVVGNYADDNYERYQVYATKLDVDGNIVWQNGFYVSDDYDTYSPSVALDPATDEFIMTFEAYSNDNRIDGNNAWHIIKMDSDGEVLWKRIWGTTGNSVYQNYSDSGNAISLSNGHFSIAGSTYATADDYENACMVTLPLDGSGTGQHGLWKYFEPKDNMLQQIRFNTTAATFDPTVRTASLYVNDANKLYYSTYTDSDFNNFLQDIRSEEGGAIEFADGSKQTFSASIIPQVMVYGEYYLRPEDSGRHLYITRSNYNIIIPYWENVKLPVGYTITIINRSGNQVTVEMENGNMDGRIYFSGGDTNTRYVGINDNGSGQMVTLIKIEEGDWNGDSHGDRWMIAGADIYDNW